MNEAIKNYEAAVVLQVVCWLIRRKARVRNPGQATKWNMEKKYFFGDDFLSADLW